MSYTVRLSTFFAALFAIGTAFVTAQPFRNEIDAFRRQDSIAMPPTGAVLFTGSSSIKLWKNLAEQFPKHTVINRGFGASTLPDVEYYLKDIVFPYKPSRIVLYCGENDFAASDTIKPETVFRRFVSVFLAIRKQYPRVPFVYISIKPSPARRHLIPSIKQANALIRDYLRRQPHAHYADVYNSMLDKHGRLMPALYVKDSLHLSDEGYRIWQQVLKRHL
jgi:lysophospholipase L1-like esterase